MKYIIPADAMHDLFDPLLLKATEQCEPKDRLVPNDVVFQGVITDKSRNITSWDGKSAIDAHGYLVASPMPPTPRSFGVDS